jgi:hypothetical protein
MVLAYSNVCGHNSEFMDRLQVTSCSCVNTYSLMPTNASAFSIMSMSQDCVQ